MMRFSLLILLPLISISSIAKDGNLAPLKVDKTGAQLMEKKCLACHALKPDPAKRSQMIAPPLQRVQEHYKPSFPDKSAFSDAIVAFVKKPSEADSLMPGAIRKFKLMPTLGYSDDEVRLIAETLFEMSFTTREKKNEHSKLSLNKGNKWKVKAALIQRVKLIQQKLNTFEASTLAAHQQLGKDVFHLAKVILLDTDNSTETFNHLHAFFASVEANMHGLISAQSLTAAKKQKTRLSEKFNQFGDYFEG